MYPCQLCGKSYKWPGDLRRHTKVKHSEKSGNSNSNDASVNTKGQTRVSRNMDCPLCKKSFMWPSDLGRHLRVIHSGSSQSQNSTPGQIPKPKQDQHEQGTNHIYSPDNKRNSAQVRILVSSQPENKSEERDSTSVTDQSAQKQGQHLEGIYPQDIPDVKTRWMQFIHPATALIVGPSGCGKTRFTVRFLTHLSKMIDQKIDEIIWCYGIKQDFHNEIKKQFPEVKFVEGLPDYSTFDAAKPRVCIIDDLMTETKGNIVSNLFSKVSHHQNTTVFYIVQNLFPKNKEQRDISLNSKYFIIFKNPRDNKQVGILGAQMGKHDLIKQAYTHATSKPHGYLLIDVTQGANDLLRVRSNIFPDDDENLVYLP